MEEAIRTRNELTSPQTKTRRKTVDIRNAPAMEWQERLVDELDTRVSINIGAKRGRITIDFADLEDLERIAQHISAGSNTNSSL